MTESGWLIEKPGSDPPEYWAGRMEWFGKKYLDMWITDSVHAIRFARKIDAEKIAVCVIEKPVDIFEHGWAEAEPSKGKADEA